MPHTVAHTHDGADGSGALALYVPASIVDAKGDLIVGSAADTVARLAPPASHLYVPRFVSGTGIRWVLDKIVKAADETVNNSSALQNDDHFAVAVAANEVWFFTMFLDVAPSSATMDFKAGWGVTGTVTTRWGLLATNAPSGTTTPGFTAVATTGTTVRMRDETETISVGTGNLTHQPIAFAGWLRGGAAGGVATFKWAQDVAEAADLKVLKDSVMRLDWLV
jgi:hypothetical protein